MDCDARDPFLNDLMQTGAPAAPKAYYGPSSVRPITSEDVLPFLYTDETPPRTGERTIQSFGGLQIDVYMTRFSRNEVNPQMVWVHLFVFRPHFSGVGFSRESG